MLGRRQVQVHPLLLDGLKAEQVGQPKRIVVARILLIECIDLVQILTRISRSIVILAKKTRLQEQFLRRVPGFDIACAGVDRVVREAASLNRDEAVEIKSIGKIARRLNSRRHLSLRTEDSLLAQYPRECFDIDKRLNHRMRHPRPHRADTAEKSQSDAVLIQRSGMNRYDGCRENVEAILISNPPQKSVPGAAVVRPVAGTDQTLASIPQLPPPRDHRILF